MLILAVVVCAECIGIGCGEMDFVEIWFWALAYVLKPGGEDGSRMIYTSMFRLGMESEFVPFQACSQDVWRGRGSV